MRTRNPHDPQHSHPATSVNVLDKEEVVARFRPLVRRVVGQAHADPQDRDDLEQDGYLGLLVASERFQPSKSVPFAAFAEKYVVGYIRNKSAGDARFHERHLAIGRSNDSIDESVESDFDVAREVNEFLRSLPTELQYIARRRYWDNVTQGAIAKELGLSRRTIVSRIDAIRIHGRLSLAHLRGNALAA